MLTVKLCKNGSSTFIVEAPSVRVFTPKQGRGKMIDVGDGRTFVVDGKDYDVAYVENARGSTLQVVKP